MITLFLSSRKGSWGLKSCIKVYLCIGSKSAKISLHVEIEFNFPQSCLSELWVKSADINVVWLIVSLNWIQFRFILYFVENVRKFYYDNKFNKFWLNLTSTNVLQPYIFHTYIVIWICQYWILTSLWALQMVFNFSAKSIMFSYDAEKSPVRLSEKLINVIGSFMSFPLNIPGFAYHKSLQVTEIIKEKR